MSKVIYYIECFGLEVSEEVQQKMQDFEDAELNFPKNLSDADFITLSDEEYTLEELVSGLNGETVPTGSSGYFRII